MTTTDKKVRKIDKIRIRLRVPNVVAVLVFRNGRMADITHENFDSMLAREGKVYAHIIGGGDIICCDDEVTAIQ